MDALTASFLLGLTWSFWIKVGSMGRSTWTARWTQHGLQLVGLELGPNSCRKYWLQDHGRFSVPTQRRTLNEPPRLTSRTSRRLCFSRTVPEETGIALRGHYFPNLRPRKALVSGCVSGLLFSPSQFLLSSGKLLRMVHHPLVSKGKPKGNQTCWAQILWETFIASLILCSYSSLPEWNQNKPKPSVLH